MSEPGTEHGGSGGQDIGEHAGHGNLLPAVGVSAKRESEAKAADWGQAQHSMSIIGSVWWSWLLDEDVFGMPSDV